MRSRTPFTILMIVLLAGSSLLRAEEADDRVKALNELFEVNLGPSTFSKDAPLDLWVNGDPKGQVCLVYPFRPMFGDSFKEADRRSLNWLHRRKVDSEQSSVWAFYSLVSSSEQLVSRKAERWMLYGYSLYFWGIKHHCMGPDAHFPYPDGRVKEKVQDVIRASENLFNEKINGANKAVIIARLGRITRWLTPPEGWPISDAIDYFDQKQAGDIGAIRAEFVFPLGWRITRDQDRVGVVEEDFERDMDYDCNMLLSGLQKSEGLTIAKVWMGEAYLHFIAMKLMVDGKFPPWAGPVERVAILDEITAWQVEVERYCRKITNK